jgi:sugar lactone lactonase YvrE
LPDKVFGQEDLDDKGPSCDNVGASGSTAADRFSLPLGVAVDKLGTVFVTDYDKNRVLRFAAGAENGADATIYTNLNGPHDVAVDPAGNLYIADTVNGQVLAYENGATGDMTPDHTMPGRNFPMGMAFTAGGDLLVADCGTPEEAGGYPPCVKGTRGVFYFKAPEAPQQQPPSAVNDSATTEKNKAVTGNVLTNDTDPQGQTLTVSANSEPANGTVTVAANGAYIYTPDEDYVGPDSFTYTVANNGGLTDTGTVTITISEEPVETGEPGLFMPVLSKPEP